MAFQTRNIPPLSIRAAVQPASINEEKRTAEMVFSTGERVKRSNFWDGDFYEELSMDPDHIRMDRLQSGRAPVLANHDKDLSSVIGVVESARIQDGKGIATVRFAKDDPTADAVWNKVRQGILPNVSVGYRTHKFVKSEGGDDKIPTFRAEDWEPYEVSIVSVPADSAAFVRSDSEQQPCIFVIGENAMELTDEQKKAADKKIADEKRAAELEATRAAAALAERQRVTDITSAVRAVKLDESVATDLISKGIAVDEARKLIFEKLAAKSEETPINGNPVITVGMDQVERNLRHAEAALILRAGSMDILTRARDLGAKRNRNELAPLNKLETDPGEYRNMSLLDMARDFVEARGHKTRGMSRDELIGFAFTNRAGQQTTSDFGTLLENLMYKLLLGQYAITSDTWRRFCATDSVTDFRPANRYRLGSFGVLDSLDENGEFKNKAMPDGFKIQVSVKTKGNILSISRETIINDDMGAIVDMTGKFGRAAALSIEKDVYALLAQNGGLGPSVTVNGNTANFFDASFGNVSTGAALSVDALDADRVQMASQQDPNSNEFLDLKPATLLIPIGLGGAARVINESRYDTTSGTAFEKPNKVVGLFRDIVDTPRISGTRRYLFTDPNESGVAALKVVFLNGAQAPFMEQRIGWRSDGSEWKVRLDYQALTFDPKGAVTNAGA